MTIYTESSPSAKRLIISTFIVRWGAIAHLVVRTWTLRLAIEVAKAYL